MKVSKLSYIRKWFILSIIFGIVAGFSAVIFYFLLNLSENFFLGFLIGYYPPKPIGEGGNLSYTFSTHYYWLIPFITALGGLISGLIVYTFAPEAEGHGTDAAIRAYHFQQGKVRWRIAPIKLVASVITIGSGGSGGREGPTAQLASSISSFLSDILKLPPEDRRKAIAVGIGAGIGSIFKTPIGGALLAAEILYKRDFESEIIYPALISSAIGYSIFGLIYGFTPIFGYYTMGFNPLRLPLYVILGFITGVFSILYVKTFYSIHNFFKKIKVPIHFKPMIGGLLMGIIALISPEVISVGYGWINIVENQNVNSLYSFLLPPIILIIALPFLKILATSLSIGSGGSGGVFAPGLFIGSFLGADVGLLFHLLLPNLVPSIAPFVILGMISFFGAAGKVPVSVLIMVIEMTGSLQLLPGAMIAVAISYFVSGNYSIYSSQVPTRKDSPAHTMEFEIPLLQRIKVRSCTYENIKINLDSEIDVAIQLMNKYDILSLPVVDQENNFIGIVYMKDIMNKKGKIVEFVVKGAPSISPESSLEEALEIMSNNKSRWVAVCDKGKLIGVITLQKIIEAYKKRI
jgi:Chloride channel protein EriC